MVIPILVSLLLILYSWVESFPLSLNSPTDLIFNQIQPLYWIGFALLLGSLATAAATIKNDKVVIIVCIAILLSMYSLYYFYPSLPGSDTNTFRGLTEYAATTRDLNPLVPEHNYYQWPGFFILGQIVITVTGLNIIPFEFIFFTILGILYVTALNVYFSSFSKKLAWASIITYFVIIYWFFNYQYAPFSLAMGILFTLFIIEVRPVKTVSLTLLTLILYAGLVLVHAFAPVFFIAYSLIMYILGRNKYYRNLFAVSLVIWLLITVFSSGLFFDQVLHTIIIMASKEYESLLSATLSTPFINLPSLYFISQAFSRGIVFLAGGIAGLGFVLFLRKKRLRQIDFALLISAGFYSISGLIVYALGQRAWFILVMPLSLGVIYFLEHRFGKYFKPIFICMLVLFAFIPLSSSFNTSQVFFQPRNEDLCANFALAHYDWQGSGSAMAHFRIITYIEAKSAGTIPFASEFQFTDEYWKLFPQSVPFQDLIIYTSGLERSCYTYNYSMEKLWQEEKYNRAYDAGPSSYILADSIPLQP